MKAFSLPHQHLQAETEDLTDSGPDWLKGAYLQGMLCSGHAGAAPTWIRAGLHSWSPYSHGNLYYSFFQLHWGRNSFLSALRKKCKDFTGCGSREKYPEVIHETPFSSEHLKAPFHTVPTYLPIINKPLISVTVPGCYSVQVQHGQKMDFPSPRSSFLTLHLSPYETLPALFFLITFNYNTKQHFLASVCF